MAGDTKERILEAALEIFARDGYSGTNIKDIADAVGIVKSALYRHFESKEDIWNSVCEKMDFYYAEHFGSKDNLPPIPKDADELYEMTLRMADFTIHDRKIIMMRKIFLSEQFRDEKIRLMTSRYLMYNTADIFTKIFDGMMKNGAIKNGDCDILAFSYTTPVSALIQLCDREPDREDEVMEKLKRFIRFFIAQNCIQ